LRTSVSGSIRYLSTDIKENTEKPLEGGAKENTTIERRRPPAWDPPILLLVDGKLEIISILGVVVANVGGGSCIRGSVIWSRQTDMGRKENKATVSTHKYSASKDLHYICNIFKGKAVYVDWAAEMPE
jgi:hypothetical protein